MAIPRYNTYVGMRYVPIFDGEWDSTKTYEPLTIVSNQGNSYTSRTFVPTGVDIDNTEYWALTGNYNAQVEYYRQQVATLSDTVDDKIGKFVTPEEYGAVADGIEDDTNAFNNAFESGYPVLANGTYKVNVLTLSDCWLTGTGTIECNYIKIEPNAILDGLTINATAQYAIYINTDDKENNTNVYNSIVRNCNITCAPNSSIIYFNLLNGKGIVNIEFNNITAKCTGNGHSVVRIHTVQNASSRPWLSPIMFIGIKALESPFGYFMYIDDAVKTDESYSGSLFKFIFEDCHYQYYTNVTQYCAYIRGVKNTVLNINTYDFPANSVIYYFAVADNSVGITNIPLSHANVMSAINGVTGYIKNAYYIQNLLNHMQYSCFRSGVYDSQSDGGSLFAYEMPVMYPAAFTDSSNNHKINGVAIPQSKALYQNAGGSCLFGNDNNTNEPVFWVYSNSAQQWTKHTIFTNKNAPHGTTAQRPSPVPVGFMYYDTTLHKPIWWSDLNNQWRDATGAAV